MQNYFTSATFIANMLQFTIITVTFILFHYTRKWEMEGRFMKFLYPKYRSVYETKNGRVFFLKKRAGTFRAYLITDEDCPGAVSDEIGRYLEIFCMKASDAKQYLEELDVMKLEN